MKARVKTLGLIVEVTFSHAIHDNGHDIIWYKTPQGASFTKDELEFITTEDDLDYWTRLEHQAAIGAIQGILSNPELFKATAKNAEEFGLIVPQAVAIDANCFAHTLVEKLKEKEERK